MKAEIEYLVSELVEAKEVNWLVRLREGRTREVSFNDLPEHHKIDCLMLDEAIKEASK